MKQLQLDVYDFHKKFDQPVRTKPTILNEEEAEFRRALIFEEALEIDKALRDGNIEEVADGCADLIYVTIGLAIAAGIDLIPVWKLVHEANMKKVGGGKSQMGKILKPDGWKEPDINGEMGRQSEAARKREADMGRNVHVDGSDNSPGEKSGP